MKTLIGKDIENYKIIDKIGKGQFGNVYKVIKNNNDNNTYAVKIISKNIINSNSELLELFKTEVTIMKKIKHKNIINLIDYFESSNNWYLIIDYCNNKDLKCYIENLKFKSLELKEAIYYLNQIKEAFLELKKFNVMHRDLKLDNIFKHNNTILVGDFGFSKQGKAMTQTRLGTPLTMAPELLEEFNKCYCDKIDIWSFGIVFYQMIFQLQWPFFGIGYPELLRDIKEKCNNIDTFLNNSFNNLRSINDINNEQLLIIKDFFKSVFVINPEKRLNWNDLFKHKIFLLFNDNYNTNNNQNTKCKNKEITTKFDKNISDNCTTKKKIIQNDYQYFKNKSDSVNKNKNEYDIINDNYKNTTSIISSPIFNIDMLLLSNKNRYIHDLNIANFMFYTAKKIRKIMKLNLDNIINNQSYFIILLLIIKATTMLYLNIKSLKDKINIFKMSYFSEFLNSKYYTETINKIEEDYNVFEIYVNYIYKIKSQLNLIEKDSQFIDELYSKNIKMNKIDSYLITIKEKLKFDINNKIIDKNILKKMYRIYVYVYYCINSLDCFFVNKGENSETFDFKQFIEEIKSFELTDLMNIEYKLNTNYKTNNI